MKFLVVTIIQFLLLFNIHCQEINNDYCDKENCSCVPFKPLKKTDKTIIYSFANGRLGNHLLAYLLLLQSKISLDVEAFIMDKTYEYLRNIYTEDSIKLKSIESQFCDSQNIDWSIHYHEHLKRFLTDKSLRHGQSIYLFSPRDEKDKFTSFRPASHLCRETKLFMEAGYRSMRNTLKYKPEILSEVEKIKNKIAKKMSIQRNKIQFIGVHNRRTDHLEFVKKRDNLQPLKPSYFYEAMDAFREDYDHTAFLYISDDMEWGRKNIKDKHKDLFFVGNGIADDPFHVGVDFALMTTSNSSITSRGTFSIFGSLLGQGEYYNEYGMIFPEHILHPDDDRFHEDLKL